MRMVIFFDLPSVSKSDHKEYNLFLKRIKKNGFVMFQESVYTKLCMNESVVQSTYKEIKKVLPKSGIVSLITLTENQFNSIEHLIGEIDTDVVMNDKRLLNL